MSAQFDSNDQYINMDDHDKGSSDPSEAAAAAAAAAAVSNPDAQSAILSAAGGAALSETQKAMNKVKKWITTGPMALKSFAFMSCAFSAAVSIFQVLASLLNPFAIIVSGYALAFSLVGMVLEVTPFICTRWCQTRIEFWVRILGRVWGRGLFYLLVAGLQFSQASFLGYISGGCVAAAAIFSFMVSWRAGSKINALHQKMIENQSEAVDMKSIQEAFHRYDTDRSGLLDVEELVAVTKALGTEFTKDELRAVFDLLDRDGSGSIEFNEFRTWFTGNKDLYYSYV